MTATRRFPRIALILGFVVLLAGAITAAVALSSSSRYETGPGTVPRDSRVQALSEFDREYGGVSNVYAEAATDMEEWAEVEPGNTSGLSIDSSSSKQEVYALFVEGKFVVTGPLSPDGTPETRTSNAGRIVFDVNGDLLSVQLWDIPMDASAPFGENFDDQ